MGARYGTSSGAINSNLKVKTNQVSVEPDSLVWEALESNKKRNNCGFHIIKGFLSKKKMPLLRNKESGYFNTFTEDISSESKSYTLDEVKTMFN